MPSDTALHPLRRLLPLFTSEWVMWAVDARGVFTVHEGPGARRGGVRLGQSVWDVPWKDPAIVEFAREVLQHPAGTRIALDGAQLLIVGAPAAEGGATGYALMVEPDGEDGREGKAASTRVVELSHPIPELGASVGDLLIINAEDPDSLGVLRRAALEELPQNVLDELQRVSPLAASSGGRGASSARREPGSTRGRPTHLRLLP